ncbi:interleukin-18-like [Rhineura floridana]|uniref:interleukin-18-like n=1 Tax=Rhineura floridana TaxID=261503 RepID=UPI002AC7FB8B|nr:interleukin-18-like [Rhineura floridana]
MDDNVVHMYPLHIGDDGTLFFEGNSWLACFYECWILCKGAGRAKGQGPTDQPPPPWLPNDYPEIGRWKQQQTGLTSAPGPDTSHHSILFSWGLEADSWRHAKSGKAQIFRNRENHVLIVRPEDQADAMAVFESMTDLEVRNESGISFNVHMYKDTNLRGLPVAFSTQWKGKTYIMKIEKGGKMRVVFKEGEVPDAIEGETSDMIFFKIPFSRSDTQCYMFESTLERGYFLAFERNQSSSATRLIIKRTELIDESTKLYPSPFPE